MKKCIQCGTDNLDFANFCDNCGAQLAAVAPPGYTPPQPPCAPPRPQQSGTPFQQMGPPQPPIMPPAQPVQPSSAPPIQQPFSGSHGQQEAAQQPPAPPLQMPEMTIQQAPQVIGFLKSLSSGAVFHISSAVESIIGRGDPSKGIKPTVELMDSDALTKGVSRLHAKIIYDNGDFYIIDMNSTNSTYLNGMKLNPQQPYGLQINDEISLGNYKMVFSV